MGYRTVVISTSSRLSYKQDYLVIRNEELTLIHLSEIGTILIDSTRVTLTSFLIAELLKQKIKVIFCDEKRDPLGEVVAYYGSHNSSKILTQQTKWDEFLKGEVWQEIIKQKINNQANVLKEIENDRYKLLRMYYNEVEHNDNSNREGHAAKVYFNTLFGPSFKRGEKNDINDALDYGYSIILSSFNKEIVSKGYSTQLGIFHRNEFNYFNLSCDLMEPFRPIVDKFVFENRLRVFDKDYRLDLVNLLNNKVKYCEKNLFLSTCIKRYVHNVLEYLSNGIMKGNIFYIYEF